MTQEHHRNTLRNSDTAFGHVAKILHWKTALLIIAMLILGFYMTSQPINPDILQLYGLHKALGTLILLLVAVRFLWRLTNKTPSYPASMPRHQILLATLMHWALYGLLFLMPIAGIVLSQSAGFPISVFGWFTVPTFLAPNPGLKEIAAEAHEAGAWILCALIALHGLAALHHQFIRKDGILKRMWW